MNNLLTETELRPRKEKVMINYEDFSNVITDEWGNAIEDEANESEDTPTITATPASAVTADTSDLLSNITKYSCHICKKFFSLESNLKRHMLNIHNETTTKRKIMT